MEQGLKNKIFRVIRDVIKHLSIEDTLKLYGRAEVMIFMEESIVSSKDEDIVSILSLIKDAVIAATENKVNEKSNANT